MLQLNKLISEDAVMMLYTEEDKTEIHGETFTAFGAGSTFVCAVRNIVAKIDHGDQRKNNPDNGNLRLFCQQYRKVRWPKCKLSDSGSSGSGVDSYWCHCAVFLGKTTLMVPPLQV
ncbi:hypothetical protein ACROYT_G015150 [Oculina patagonica]